MTRPGVISGVNSMGYPDRMNRDGNHHLVVICNTSERIPGNYKNYAYFLRLLYMALLLCYLYYFL